MKKQTDAECYLDIENLLIDDQYLLKLMGWQEIDFIGNLGNKLNPRQKAKAKCSALCFLRESLDKIESPYSNHKLTFKMYSWLQPDSKWDFLNSDYTPFKKRTNPEIQLVSKVLSTLICEVDRYNNIINNIKVIDKLREIGNHIELIDRENAIKALGLAREDLIRALKTERILRENPGFNPDYFTDNITAIEALQVCDVATGYGKSFQETMEIAIEVQKEIKGFLH